MKFKWKKQDPQLNTKTAMELWLYGEPDKEGTPYSYTGYVYQDDEDPKEVEWFAASHELYDSEYLMAIEDMVFKSRSSAMREFRKRFAVAWISATEKERSAVWDGRK
jgi:hypothetical protein